MPNRKDDGREGQDPTRQSHLDLIEADPQITILSDHPLKPEQVERDCFALRYHVGPIYDIVRHPDTQLPMAIAIYGTWGTGKTSAMKWLHGLLNDWNKLDKVKKGNGVKVQPVWFYPWKYHSKEDVWRGLIAEVVIESIKIKNADIKTVTKAAKQFGIFLGRSFIHALSSLKLKADVGGSGAEFDFSSIREIVSEYERTITPEKGYLNEFEQTLSNWINDVIGERERMLIFIDDLDRCMPNVALQVLEALKLYLDIDKLIFVVGVDREVIDELVKKHYTRLGLKEDKSEKYLAKMFQVEVELSPSEQLIGRFLDDQIADIEPLQALDDTARTVFREIIYRLAGRIPREIKRLINSALMTGSGSTKLLGEDRMQQISFEQGMQLFFIRQILKTRYGKSWLVGDNLGDDFFSAWSGIVTKKPDIQKCLHVPKEYIESLAEPRAAKLAGLDVPGGIEASGTRKEDIVDLYIGPPEYNDLLRERRFASLFELLSDEDLGELMRIEYPRDTEAISQAVGRSPDEEIILEVIARSLGRQIDELVEEDYSKVEMLSLAHTGVVSIDLLQRLTNLQHLDLSATQVANLEPLKGLTSLQILDLESAQVTDLEPIKVLTSLLYLNLSGTQVTDLEPLKGLTNLQYLDLSGTQVADLEPLKGLTNLQYLFLSGTQVTASQVKALKEKLPNCIIES